MGREFDEARHCGARNHQNGARCENFKGWRTDHPGFGRCALHTGSTPSGKAMAASEAAAAALAKFGQPASVEPRQAMFEVVWEAAGNVAFLRAAVANLEQLTLHHEGAYIDESGIRHTTIREDVKALVKLYGEWTDRLARYAAEAVKIGLDERMIQLAEAQCELIVKVVNGALDAAGVTGEPRSKALQVAAAELRLHAAPRELVPAERN